MAESTSKEQPDKPCASGDEVETRTAEKLADDPQLTLPKLVFNSIAAVLMYMWCDLLGRPVYPLAAYVALLISPLRLGWSPAERYEVRSMISIYFFVLSSGLLPLWCLKRGGQVGRTLFGLYVAWYMLADTAPLRGGRFLPSLRQRNFWRHFAAYFPMSLTRTAKLDPKRNYIFGYHPHGVISMGALCNFTTEATGFSALFPGLSLRLLTLGLNFRIPVFREYLLGIGVNDVSRKSIEGNLARGPGASVMIVIGGARESLETAPGTNKLILGNRKGFVKLALQRGASLVPVYSFGETDLFGVYASNRFRRLQLWLQKQLGFGIPFFFGRALTGGVLHRVFGMNRGVMPLRMPVQSVVGRPIHVDAPVPKPTQEQIDELHARYVEELRKIYDDWKAPFLEERTRAMDRQGDRAKEVLRRGSFHLEKIESMVIN
ncbi:DGAT2B [Symbiodinium natans]|uniref:Acyltransferase n=1 Tax=Symbiodinium natans TaxID=878477 RepID=A0A812UWU2_9DINO|nr:DGAT2B [Symbiodinium natans]